MQVTVPKRNLAEGLGHIERVIPTRSSNPGLSLMRLELRDNCLVCSGSNLDIDIEAVIPAEVTGAGEVALPTHVFGQVVRALPGDRVGLTFGEREVAIESGSYATKLQLSDPGAAPRVTFPNRYAASITGANLAKALSHVRYAVAVAEYQAIFRGVKLEFGEGTRAVATDGFRLAYYHLDEATGLQGEVVLPSRSVDELIKLLGEGEARLELGETQLSVSTGRFRLNLKLMEGSFPDYRRVIPTQFELRLTVDAKGLADAVSRVALLADKTTNNRVDFFVSDGALQITAEGAYGRSQEALSAVHEGPESQMVLAYNAKFLVDALQPIHGEARLSFSGRTGPTVLTALEDAGYLAMVVPLRTG